MAEPNSTAPTNEPPPPTQEWDEARCKASLALLEQLQNQINDLRSIIPTITAAAANQGTSKSTYFKQYSTAAVGGSELLEKFRRDWKDKETQDIFGKARIRRVEDPDLSKAITVPKDGWIEELDSDGVGDVNCVQESGEDIKKVVESWKEKNPNVKIDLEDGEKRVIMQYTAAPFRLRFTVTPSSDEGGKHIYMVECAGGKPIFRSMERCISLRPKPDRLYDTLDMLAAYPNLSTAPCALCTRLLDRQGMLPTARRIKSSSSQTEGGPEAKWNVLHEGCLPR